MTIKRIYKTIHILLIIAFAVGLMLVGCTGPAPTASPAPTATPSLTASPPPPPTVTATPVPLPEVPIYRNYFEGTVDLPAEGISSSKNTVQINTQNVAYQSGLQSVEASGTLAADAYSTLTIQFSMDKMINQASIDLSNKSIGFSYFIPADAPIDTIVLVARQGNNEVSLAATSPAGSPGAERGKWHYQQFDIADIYANNSWALSNLSNDESRQVVRNCDEIVLAGLRKTAGSAVATSFLIDDFKWISDTLADHPPVDPNADTIRKAANAAGLKIGAITFYGWPGNWFMDPWYRYTLATDFNLTTVGGGPFPADRPADLASYQFDYSNEDKKMAWAQANGLLSEAGTGSDPGGLPKWVLDLSESEAKTILENKVRSDVSHFKGQELYWGVMNEVVDGTTNNGLRSRQYKNPNDPSASPWFPYGAAYSPWAANKNDTSLIEDAFATAQQADPAAKLYLNDFDIYAIGGTRAEYFYNLVTGMKKKGVPIDGVGFELHLAYPAYDPVNDLTDLNGYFSRVDQNIKRYAAAGMLVMFTEVECQVRMDDLNLNTPAGQAELKRRQQVQAEVYARLTKLAMDNKNVAFITFWHLPDTGESSFQFDPHFLYTDAFLFDKNYDPKPAYQAVLDTLEGRR